jgi:hypothetical protein
MPAVAPALVPGVAWDEKMPKKTSPMQSVRCTIAGNWFPKWKSGLNMFAVHHKTVGLILTLVAAASSTACKVHHRAVLTYHYDNLRTGWNSEEKRLTPASVVSPKFGILHSVTLDDQVDAQPLVVPDEKITGGPDPGRHDVVYVATEANTIYAIDASSGAVLLHPNFGPAVPEPLGCNNNGPSVGITSTPVIDLNSNTIYLVTYTLDVGNPTYHIHALDLGNLKDKIPPVEVKASHTLSDGTTFNFDARYQRQRPALIEANGNVYAGFGSFCDFSANQSRGWVLGWKLGSLTPLAANQLNDRLASSPDTFFLSSVWMSGYGISADGQGNLYFVTGNSDSNASGTTYNGTTDVQESVVKLSPDLQTVQDLFTPSDVQSLDEADNDYGSGGALLLAPQPGPLPHLVAAAGKNGNMYLLNREHLGGYTPGGPDKVVGIVNIGGCWCGQSYFSDGVGHVVSSGGSNVTLWRVETSPSVKLVNEGTSASIGGAGQDPGFFTTISSNGSKDAVVWAISRPNGSPPPAAAANVSLYAFGATASAGTLPTLFSATAGTWPYTSGNANLVPVVSGAKVFVASYRQLTIFGLH